MCTGVVVHTCMYSLCLCVLSMFVCGFTSVYVCAFGLAVEEIEQMNGLFQQKQRELLSAVTKVEELSRQLETLKSVKMEPSHDRPSSTSDLERLYKELQVRNTGLRYHFKQ